MLLFWATSGHRSIPSSVSTYSLITPAVSFSLIILPYRNFIEGLSDATNSISDFLSSMIWPKCEYRPDIVETVKNKLQEVIKGQDEGIDLILNSLRAWEFQRLLGIHQPFVMAITGPTGVGKTETSYQIANALFPTHKYSNSMSKPCGFLSLRGEDYSNSSDLFATGINNVS